MGRRFLFVLVVFLAPILAFSTTIHVPTDQPTIQAGINAAASGDSVLVAPGTYIGDGNRDIDFGGRNIVLMSETGPTETILDCQADTTNRHRAFIFQHGESQAAEIMGFTIKNGFSPPIYYDQYGTLFMGGAILCDHASSPIIVNCVFMNNGASGGGALSCIRQASPILQNCNFLGNYAVPTFGSDAAFGGAINIWDSGQIVLNDCIFRANTAKAGDGVAFVTVGGAIYGTQSNIYLRNCTFDSNIVSNKPQGGIWSAGGAICVDNGILLVAESTKVCFNEVQGDVEYNHGGGIAVALSRAMISQCQFYHNRADSGGALAIQYSDSTVIRNCDFISNIANSIGNALCIDSSKVILENSIMCYNIGGQVVYASIPGIPPDPNLTPNAVCCDIYGNTNGDWVGCLANQFGHNGNISSDPLFCDTVNNDFHLNIVSPCAPENNACSTLIGTLVVACGSEILALGLKNENMGHVLSATPAISWNFHDLGGLIQDSFLIAIGTDTNWAYSEMWNPGPVASSDTFVTYAGAPLQDGQTYYVRLRVHNGVVWSNLYDTSFHMNSVPSVPAPSGPVNEAVVHTASSTLYLHNSSDAENDTLTYDFYIDHHSMFGPPSPIKDSDIVQGNDSTGWTVTAPLNENWRYLWKARAFDQYEKSGWSGYGEFYVNAVEEAPWPFALVMPPDTAGSIVFDMLPRFYWGLAIDPDPFDTVRYTLYLAVDSNFQYVKVIDSIPSFENQYITIDSLFFGTRYWWKVKAADKTGLFTYSSDVKSFRTWKLGDANSDWNVNIIDVSFLINALYKEGPAPLPRYVGDVNGNCAVNILDVSYLINFLYKDGPAPKIGCL